MDLVTYKPPTDDNPTVSSAKSSKHNSVAPSQSGQGEDNEDPSIHRKPTRTRGTMTRRRKSMLAHSSSLGGKPKSRGSNIRKHSMPTVRLKPTIVEPTGVPQATFEDETVKIRKAEERVSLEEIIVEIVESSTAEEYREEDLLWDENEKETRKNNRGVVYEEDVGGG